MGLRVRNLKLVNLSLLTKWSWTLLVEDSNLWRDILITRYDETFISSHWGARCKGLWSSSSWWKEICLLRSKEECNFDWFSDGIVSKVRSSFHTSFWKDSWLGSIPLMFKFPTLLSISLLSKDMMVSYEWLLIWS